VDECASLQQRLDPPAAKSRHGAFRVTYRRMPSPYIDPEEGRSYGMARHCDSAPNWGTWCGRPLRSTTPYKKPATHQDGILIVGFTTHVGLVEGVVIQSGSGYDSTWTRPALSTVAGIIKQHPRPFRSRYTSKIPLTPPCCCGVSAVALPKKMDWPNHDAPLLAVELFAQPPSP
jgi:hypothetical protein